MAMSMPWTLENLYLYLCPGVVVDYDNPKLGSPRTPKPELKRADYKLFVVRVATGTLCQWQP